MLDALTLILALLYSSKAIYKNRFWRELKVYALLLISIQPQIRSSPGLRKPFLVLQFVQFLIMETKMWGEKRQLEEVMIYAEVPSKWLARMLSLYRIC